MARTYLDLCLTLLAVVRQAAWSSARTKCSRGLYSEVVMQLAGDAITPAPAPPHPRRPLLLAGLSARLESRVASTRLSVAAALSGEVDSRLAAVQEGCQQRLQQLGQQLERLAGSKVDMLLLTQHTEQVCRVLCWAASKLCSSCSHI